MELSEWRGHWTFFPHNKATRPDAECSGGWPDFCRHIAPMNKPMVIRHKEKVRYFVPTCLKVAPLVGKTRERAKKMGMALEGKQRSAAHVTEAGMVVVDLDGVHGPDFERCLRRLAADGAAFLAYSSYSHGSPQKTGVRSRVIVPVDKPLAREAYKRAADGLQRKYFDGQADPRGFSLCQQMGVWATSPQWSERAFRIAVKGRVLPTSELLTAPSTTQLRANKTKKFVAAAYDMRFDEGRVRTALRWLDPKPHPTWIDTGLYLKAAYRDEAYSAWLDWSNTAPAEITSGNTDEYSPDLVWGGLDPIISPDVGAAALFAAARDRAAELITVAVKSGAWCQSSRDAVGYLMAHHKRFFGENFKV